MSERPALALLAAFLLASCAPSAPVASGTTQRNAWTEPGHLRIGSSEEPDSLNPMYANDQAAGDVANLLYEPLFRYDQNGEFVPAAATVVPTLANGGISRDGKTITFHFRHGMRWSDGAPYDGRDFVFTWHAVMNPHNSVRLQIGWDDVRAMQLRDPYTVVVRLKAINAGILGDLAGIGGSGYPPIPAHLLATLPSLDRAPFNAAPISSGPFVLTKWNHGASLEFAPNPYYWRGAPGLQQISYRIIPNSETLLSEIRTHEIDVYDSVSENQIGELKTLSGVTISKHLSANWRRLQFNCAKPQLSDPRVRLAIAEGVDWDWMLRTIFHGYDERAASDVVPTSWAAPPIKPWPYDPDAAKRLLDAAGWTVGADGMRAKNGMPLAFSVSTTPAKQANVQAEVQMQQQLRTLGIALEIKNYPTNLLFAHDGPIYTGRYDSEFTIETNGPDPDNEGAWSERFIPPVGANTSWLRDPIITQTSHAALLTYDRAKRRALYWREEARIHQLVPAVFFYWQNQYAAVNSDLRGWRPATYFSDLWNAWEWRI
ncbi:MAG TPA: peptide ABC transporter substrate-binding protein [Candidatus Sulfotelmatobacter sp.]|nr:peptide ABC transporter substrate-binding protein [Candidatus Sulfotelmatobacter sp.]